MHICSSSLHKVSSKKTAAVHNKVTVKTMKRLLLRPGFWKFPTSLEADVSKGTFIKRMVKFDQEVKRGIGTRMRYIRISIDCSSSPLWNSHEGEVTHVCNTSCPVISTGEFEIPPRVSVSPKTYESSKTMGTRSESAVFTASKQLLHNVCIHKGLRITGEMERKQHSVEPEVRSNGSPCVSNGEINEVRSEVKALSRNAASVQRK